MIIRNAVECLECGDVIESKHRHDFVFCTCGNVAVDGGHAYLKRTFKSTKWRDISVEVPDVPEDTDPSATKWRTTVLHKPKPERKG